MRHQCMNYLCGMYKINKVIKLEKLVCLTTNFQNAAIISKILEKLWVG